MIYLEALQELLLIVRQPGVPRDMVRNAAKLTERIELCLVSVTDQYSPVPAVRLEATPGFLDFLQAARGQEWRRAVALARALMSARRPRGFDQERAPQLVHPAPHSEFLFN